MIPIPLSFTGDGFQFSQLTRSGNLAIYRKTKVATGWVGFEVVRIKPRRGFTVKGEYYPPAEAYPGSEKWGIDGFSCHSYPRAQVKLAELASFDAKNATPESEGVAV